MNNGENLVDYGEAVMGILIYVLNGAGKSTLGKILADGRKKEEGLYG